MDWSAGQEPGGLSWLFGRDMVAGRPTAVGIREEASDELTAEVVAAWDTNRAGDVSAGSREEGAEVGEKYLFFCTAIKGDFEKELVTAFEELVAVDEELVTAL